MNATHCTRCNDAGHIAGYAHVMNGVCFKCGRGAKGAAKVQTSARERSICALAGMIAAARRAAAEGDLDGWLADVSDVERGATLAVLLATAPADVRARAEAALRAIQPWLVAD
jgi:hypothetical protein